jgi:general secretion pathway protein M
MNPKPPKLTLPPALVAARAQALTRWQALAARERLAVAAAAALVGLWLVFAIAVQPAWRTIRDTPKQIDALDVQLQAMQRLAAETNELRTVSPVGTTQQQDALLAATARLGPEKARITMQGDRATLTLTGITGAQLREWLGEVRSGARVRPIETQLSRGPNGYTGTLIVAMGGTS